MPADGLAVRRVASAHVLLDAATSIDGTRLVLDDATAHHLRRVVRLRDGEPVTVTDGAGRWRATTAVLVGDTIELEAVADVVVEPARPDPITIAAAIPKGDRLEWMVQKVTELGVDRLVLLDCARSVVRWDASRAEKQRRRLRRVADDALRQSRRVWSLELDGPVAATDVLADASVAEPGGHPIGRADRTIAVGPEGGWNDTERGMISRSVDLGPSILRTETAAIAAATLCVVPDH